MSQGQGQQAIELLKRFAPSAGAHFRAQAYGLLGVAYENAGQYKEAAEAYETAVPFAEYAFLKAQYLSDAGRSLDGAGRHGQRRSGPTARFSTKMDSTATVERRRCGWEN